LEGAVEFVRSHFPQHSRMPHTSVGRSSISRRARGGGREGGRDRERASERGRDSWDAGGEESGIEREIQRELSRGEGVEEGGVKGRGQEGGAAREVQRELSKGGRGGGGGYRTRVQGWHAHAYLARGVGGEGERGRRFASAPLVAADKTAAAAVPEHVAQGVFTEGGGAQEDDLGV